MKNTTIKNVGKLTFGITFILGNALFWSYTYFKMVEIGIAGMFLLTVGTLINAVIFLGLLIYGWLNREQFKICLKSALIILLNIPVLLFYLFLIR